MTTQTQETTLATIAQPFNLPDVIKNKVLDTLAPFVADAGLIAREAEGVIVTDASQTEAIAKSRALRLRLQKVRTGADKARKALKGQLAPLDHRVPQPCRSLPGKRWAATAL